jgi:DMSO/TMAO reductase YedYZ molybdopterin-dependent catalytic subunit
MSTGDSVDVLDLEPSGGAPAPRPGWPWAAVAGVLAAAAGLATGEFVAGFSSTLRSPVVGVGDRVITHVPASVREWAIRTFSTSDKKVLVAGIVLVVALLGAVIGVVALRHSRLVGLVATGTLLIVGIWAALSEPHAVWTAVFPTLIGGLVGLGVLAILGRARPAAPAVAAPVAMGVDRRRFLIGAGGVAVGTVATGSLGMWLQHKARNVAERAAVILPKARKRLPPPAADPAEGIIGLTPRYVPNGDFYRIDTAIVVPSVTASKWHLTVKGMVDRTITLSYNDLLARPMIEADVTLSCVSNEVGGDLVGNARWLGCRLDDLLHEAGIHPDADQIVGRSVDDFTAGFPVSTLDGRNAIIAVGMNGEPLPVTHGYPARLVVPGLYGYVSATKWLSSIELTRFDRFEGYWVPRGWAARGPIKTESRIDVPRRTTTPGPTVIAGVAWAPHRGISKVEAQVEGEDWMEATLDTSAGSDSWCQWWVNWDASPGRHRMRCRATDGEGTTQTEERAPPAPDGASGWHTITVDFSQ